MLLESQMKGDFNAAWNLVSVRLLEIKASIYIIKNKYLKISCLIKNTLLNKVLYCHKLFYDSFLDAIIA